MHRLSFRVSLLYVHGLNQRAAATVVHGRARKNVFHAPGQGEPLGRGLAAQGFSTAFQISVPLTRAPRLVQVPLVTLLFTTS